MVLSKQHPRLIRYRSVQPVLTPMLPQKRDGTVANVVVPTGIDRRDDLGTPDRFDVYYGMADSRIGVARRVLQVCLLIVGRYPRIAVFHVFIVGQAFGTGKPAFSAGAPFVPKLTLFETETGI